jgi:hypothetical protein
MQCVNAVAAVKAARGGAKALRSQSQPEEKVCSRIEEVHYSFIMLRLLVKVVRFLRVSDFAGCSAGLVLRTYRPGRLDVGDSRPLLYFCCAMSTGEPQPAPSRPVELCRSQESS